MCKGLLASVTGLCGSSCCCLPWLSFSPHSVCGPSGGPGVVGEAETPGGPGGCSTGHRACGAKALPWEREMSPRADVELRGQSEGLMSRLRLAGEDTCAGQRQTARALGRLPPRTPCPPLAHTPQVLPSPRSPHPGPSHRELRVCPPCSPISPLARRQLRRRPAYKAELSWHLCFRDRAGIDKGPLSGDACFAEGPQGPWGVGVAGGRLVRAMLEGFGDDRHVCILFSRARGPEPPAPHPRVPTSLPSLVCDDNGVLLWDKTNFCVCAMVPHMKEEVAHHLWVLVPLGPWAAVPMQG